jgi:Family of unknown function (DUF6481)
MGSIPGPNSTNAPSRSDRAAPIASRRLRQMSRLKQNTLNDRLSDATAAKQAMVAKFLRRPGLDDPAVAERRAARAAVSAARDARLAEREAQRAAEKERIASEREARAMAEEAQRAIEAERVAAEKAATEAELEVQRKAARDARYAARKARK